MKAVNEEDVKKAVRIFSFHMLASVFVAVLIFGLYLKTSSVELHYLLAEAERQEELRRKQIRLTESVDTLFYYMNKLNTDPMVNFPAVNGFVGQRRNQLLNELSHSSFPVSGQDFVLYRNLLEQLEVFSSVKTSIRTSTLELEDIKERYYRCQDTNKELSRRMYTSEAY